jgi:septal ring factor EnvC (AmiA/AmiB activator)
MLQNCPRRRNSFAGSRAIVKTNRQSILPAQSDRLKAQAQALQSKLIETAARVQTLEKQKIDLDIGIEKLANQYKVLSASFARDRVAVARLLAVIERLQHDTPPAMVLRPDDALGAARGAMLIGASLPDVYAEAAALAQQRAQADL